MQRVRFLVDLSAGTRFDDLHSPHLWTLPPGAARRMRVSTQSLVRTLAVLLVLTMLCPLVYGQRRPNQPFNPNPPNQPFQQPNSGASNAAGAACCGMYLVIMIGCILLSLAYTGLWIFIAIWVYKDATSRAVDNSGLWLVLVLFTHMIGLIIYIVTRPQGELKTCRECGKKRLRESERCPHCRAA